MEEGKREEGKREVWRRVRGRLSFVGSDYRSSSLRAYCASRENGRDSEAAAGRLSVRVSFRLHPTNHALCTACEVVHHSGLRLG